MDDHFVLHKYNHKIYIEYRFKILIISISIHQTLNMNMTPTMMSKKCIHKVCHKAFGQKVQENKASRHTSEVGYNVTLWSRHSLCMI